MVPDLSFQNICGEDTFKKSYICQMINNFFIIFMILFAVRSIDNENRNILVWLVNYTRMWIMLSLPYLAIRNRLI